MKRIKLIIQAVAVTVFITTLLCGCGTTPKQATYKTLAGVGAAASNAGDALAAARLQGKVSDADWDKARTVQTKFLLAYNQACQLAAHDYTAFSPASLLSLESELLNTINLILQKQ